jgi:VanZ family protein
MSGDPQQRAWWVVAAWAVFQLALTSLPGSALPQLPVTFLDKVAHFGLYGVLGALVARAATLSGWPRRQLVAAWLVVIAGGVLDELHQLFMPGRECSALDWLMDATGAAAGLWLGTLMMRSRVSLWLR